MGDNKRFDLEKHLAQEHKVTGLSVYLKEIVYGGNDGIVTTFAVVAGFAGAQINPAGSSLPVLAVLLFGFANLFADGVSMALGNFLSTRSAQDIYRGEKAKEEHEIIHNPRMEMEESIEILVRKGFARTDAQKLVEIYMKNDTYWIDFMMHDELELEDTEKDNAFLMAASTFISFVLFGFIPLVPYVFFKGNSLFIVSCIATFTALTLLGLLRWQIAKLSLLRAVGETLLLGGAAAIVAYIVGTFFKV